MKEREKARQRTVGTSRVKDALVDMVDVLGAGREGGLGSCAGSRKLGIFL
jgi:hypothetical protein